MQDRDGAVDPEGRAARMVPLCPDRLIAIS
jgi:hypothetical protein